MTRRPTSAEEGGEEEQSLDETDAGGNADDTDFGLDIRARGDDDDLPVPFGFQCILACRCECHHFGATWNPAWKRANIPNSETMCQLYDGHVCDDCAVVSVTLTRALPIASATLATSRNGKALSIFLSLKQAGSECTVFLLAHGHDTQRTCRTSN